MGLPSEIWDLKAIKPRAVDVRELRLAPDEGYILSRIDGPLSLRELSAISGLAEEHVADIVSRLVAHGVIEGPPGLAPPAPKPESTAEPRTLPLAIAPKPSPDQPSPVMEPKTLPRADAPKPPPDLPSPAPDQKTLPRADAPKPPPDLPSPAPDAPPSSPRVLPRARPSTRVPGMPPPGARGAAARAAAGAPRASSASAPFFTSPLPPVASSSPAVAAAPDPAPGAALAASGSVASPPAAPTAPPPASPAPSPAAIAFAAAVASPVGSPAAASAADAASTTIGQLGSIEIGLWGVTHVGVVRKNNEDCFLLVDLTESAELTHPSSVEVGAKGVLCTVSDGMGGENAGEVASALTVAAIRDYVQAGLHEDPGEALAASVVHANKKVIEAATEPERSGMGAAVVSVLVRDGVAHLTEVGDCRAYLFRGGAFTQLTKDQTHVQVLIDQGLMTPEAAKKSRAKSVVLQAVGKQEELSVTQRALTLREGDRMLLCSDGLTVNVTDLEIADKVGGPLEGAVEALVALANARGGIDNVTVVIIEVTGALQPSHPEERVQETLKTVREFEIGGGS